MGTLYLMLQSARRGRVGSRQKQYLPISLPPRARKRLERAVYRPCAQLLLMVAVVACHTAWSSWGRLQNPSLQIWWVMCYSVNCMSLLLSIFYLVPIYYHMNHHTLLLLLAITALTNATLREDVLEQQLADLMAKIKGKTVAMLTNPTSVDGKMQPLFDRILSQRQQYNVTFKCFFAPEHGLRGDQQAGDGDEDYIDPQTGIQVYSLYGVRKAPTDAQLQGVDMFIYDIQDVGARYYTYIWTLTYSIQACAKNNVEVVIFDRPNPIGRKVEGCPLKMDAGLIGRLLPGQTFTVPQRYGLTVGELIGYLKVWLPFFKLTVIKMSKWYIIQDNEWVLSSPNIPTLDIVYIYSGLGLFEGTSVSEGRGTTKPFQIIGNPNVNAADLLRYFKSHSETGYGKTFLIREAYFIPTFSKFVGKVCGGVELHLLDRQNFDSVETALHLMKAFQGAITDGSMKFYTSLDKMFGVQGFFSNIQTTDVKTVLNDCSAQRGFYMELSRKAWLYDVEQVD